VQPATTQRRPTRSGKGLEIIGNRAKVTGRPVEIGVNFEYGQTRADISREKVNEAEAEEPSENHAVAEEGFVESRAGDSVR
jgi:hypothetical protein